MKRKIMKNEKGITLIALVVTIIVLIILAGISINLVLGENGIIAKSKEAKLQHEISADLETLNIEYGEYLIEKEKNKINKTFLEYLEDKGYIVEYDDELKQVGRVTLNGKVYLVDTSEKVQIEYLSEADGTASLMPRITKMEVAVTSNTAKVDVELINTEGVTLKYIIQKEGQTQIIEEKTISDLTYTFNNLEKSTTYTVTVEASNEYGTTKRKATIKTISLSELTNGKASFEITPNTKWQKEVTAKIISSYSDENTILQYKIGKDGEWTPYTEEFKVSENGTLYGRYYDSTTEEIGYTFTLGVDVIDDIKPELTITDEQINAKTIQVTVNANDNETGMPETIEYKYYIGTDGIDYTLKETSNTNTYLYEELNASTQYYIKVTAIDNAENEGEIVKPITTDTPILVSNITLDKTEATIGNTNTLQLTATVEPDNAEDKTLNWSSSNTSIATVSTSGLVTPKSTGTVQITCASNDGGASASCSVTIVNGSLIYTRADLEAIALKTSGKYILMNDIDLSGKNWTPISTFSGTLDGNGYSIKNLTINNTTEGSNGSTKGFFKQLKPGAVVKNLKFVNVSISSASWNVGTICGEIPLDDGTVKLLNIGIESGTIKGYSYVASFAGKAFTNLANGKIEMENCYSNAKVVSTNGYDTAGLIVPGGATSSKFYLTMNRCYFNGTISSDTSNMKRFGPVEGMTENDNSSGPQSMSINNCYYNKQKFTLTTGTKATGLTTAQFADSSNFANWDFTNTWVMKNGVPELRIFVKEEQ